MIRHNLQLVDYEAILESDKLKSTFADLAKVKAGKNRHSILRLKHQMVHILTNTVVGWLQV